MEHYSCTQPKKARIFGISKQNIEYQLNKETKPLINLKTIVLKEYHNFLDMFQKMFLTRWGHMASTTTRLSFLETKKLSNLSHSASPKSSNL